MEASAVLLLLHMWYVVWGGHRGHQQRSLLRRAHRDLGEGHAPRRHMPAASCNHTPPLLLLFEGMLRLRNASWALLLLLLSVLGRSRARHNPVLTAPSLRCADAAAPAGVGNADMVVRKSTSKWTWLWPLLKHATKKGSHSPTAVFVTVVSWIAPRWLYKLEWKVHHMFGCCGSEQVHRHQESKEPQQICGFCLTC